MKREIKQYVSKMKWIKATIHFNDTPPTFDDGKLLKRLPENNLQPI